MLYRPFSVLENTQISEISQIEDESHFLIYCNNYSILRNEFYEKIEHIIPNFKQLSPLQIIRELMTSSDHYKRNWLRKLFEEFGWTDGLRLGLRTDLHKMIALVATPLRG